MKRFKEKICVVSTIVMFITLCLSGCSMQKNITLNDEGKSERKEKINTLERVKQLNINEKKSYMPIYWKDDNNIIAINNETTGNNYGFYNINLENSEATKINEFKVVIASNEVIKGRNNKHLLLIKDKKLLLYDAENNTIQEIYNLDKLVKEIETEYKIENDTDFLGKSTFEVVNGSDKYVSIIAKKQCDGYHYNYVKIIDLETNEIIELAPKEDLELSTIFYSKSTKKFYVSSPSERLYSFSLESPEDFKEVIKIPHIDNYSWTVDYNGEFVYFFTNVEKNEIIKYDVKNNNLAKIEGINFIENNEFDERIGDIYLRGNLISFKTFSFKNKDCNLYMGMVKENKINTFGKLKIEKTNEAKNIFISLMNENGDKMFTGTCYYSSDIDSRYVYTVEKIK